MQSKKTSKTHTSTRKKASPLAKTSARTKKAALKATKSARKAKLTKKQKLELERQKRLEKLISELWQRTYDDYQQGKLHLLFR